MKLNLLPARTGATWVKLGMRTFFRQPLALAGLFFMFMALMSVASMVPLIGLPVAMTLLPAATLGLMAASREAASGKFPMPLMLLTRPGPPGPTSRSPCRGSSRSRSSSTRMPSSSPAAFHRRSGLPASRRPAGRWPSCCPPLRHVPVSAYTASDGPAGR